MVNAANNEATDLKLQIMEVQDRLDLAEELIVTQWMAEAEAIFARLTGSSLGQLRLEELERAGLGNLAKSMDVDENGSVTIVEWRGYLKAVYESKGSPAEAGVWT